MPSLANSDHTERQQLGCFGSFIQEILDTIISLVLFIGSYLLILVLLLFVADGSQSLRLLSGVGLLAIGIGMFFFLRAIQAQKNFDTKERQAKNDLKNSDSLFLRTIFRIHIFLFGYGKRKLYTLAGLAVSITSIFIDFLIEIGSGEFIGYFNTENWTFWRIVLSIAPFFLGIIADWVKRNESEFLNTNFAAKALIFFGVLKFYPNILLFFTGLAGGNEAFLAAKNLSDIISLEFFLFEWIPNSYEGTNSYTLLKYLGLTYFIIFYFIIPAVIFWSTRATRKKYKDAIYYEGKGETPMTFVDTAYFFSLLVLIIPIYVGWHEGWVQMIFGLAIYVIVEIATFLKELF
ncbi:MAG: hypothetical protein DHS20C13_22170 [Thermodesulfobacteriota bacterium]|nr:MAG: hypothetical protein DHS20C13_22170 [Thermodesulfobacteriota bacterium]GJM35914.1 MAG: hypothetical protein DHS20C18_49150 [Saprospiraceae bacterium]